METSFQRSATPLEKAEDFIKNETQFHLGVLTTEQSHPKTRTLSQTLAVDVPAGMRQLYSVDDDLPPVLKKTIASEEFAKLEGAIYQSLSKGGKVSFSGCGATGRLSPSAGEKLHLTGGGRAGLRHRHEAAGQREQGSDPVRAE